MRVETRLAERLNSINPSQTLAITSKAKKLKKEGKDIVNLAAGEPDFDTPDFIKEKAYQAIKEGFTKYTPITGIPELKEAICKKFKKDNNLIYSPSQIVVSNGAKHSIFNTLFALIDKEDEVLIPSPYWVSYPEMVNLCQGIVRFVGTTIENDFKIEVKELEKYITPKTKILILNSPSNPTGALYSTEALEAIAKICVERKIFVISDEIYEKLIYDNLKHTSIASFNKDIYDLTISVNGLSKSFSMTGWRIGYLAAPPDIVEAISRIQSHTTSNPVSISQKAALGALEAENDFSSHVCKEFQKRRDYVVSRLNEMNKISYAMPKGAFYIFCNISKTGLDSLTFSNRLLDQMLVSVIPGKAFGWDDYVRISFAASIEQLTKGMDRLEEWLKKQSQKKY
ncbi:MAG: pyridoxal phosphate-dependent aminotransferase [Candidatus Omnitrophica bacterium]|nr:pyridoxal phosphate-dependent aminotransferase [Candidatus Omnitrophota bacterium]